MTMRKYILLIMLCISFGVSAQVETIIVGSVVNGDTGEPIPNTNIYFRNTTVGTTSNETGDFALRCLLDKKRTLVVSSVGYHTQHYSIEPGQMAGIEVEMKERQALLPEILATPGENPAIYIINKVRANRQQNDRYINGSGAQTLNATTNVYISHIGRRQLKRSLWRSLQSGMIKQNDSTMLLPLFVRDEQVQIEGSRSTRINTLREQAIILSPTDYTALLSIDGNISIYQNNISLLGHSFLSPLAASGMTAYNYYLADSVRTETGLNYIIHFRPKNAFYATLSGEMHIDSASYAVRHVSAQASPQANINYLGDAQFVQTFAPDNSLQLEKVSAMLDFAVTLDTTKRVMPTALVEYTMRSEQEIKESAYVYADTSAVASNIDSIAETPAIRVATWIGKIITTGYIPTGTIIDIGHVQEILQVNKHETVHIGLPVRTNDKLMKNVCLEANVAYGVRDRAWKGMGRASFNLPTPRRNILTIEYRDHYAWTEVDDFSRLHHENTMGYGLMDFTAYTFEALHNNRHTKNTAARRRQAEVRTENDWHNNVETQLYARLGWQNYGDPLVGYNKLPYYSYQSLGGIVRIGFGERKTDLWFKRYHSRTPYPVIYAGIEGGSYQTQDADSYRLYGKLNLMVRHTVPLGIGGELTYAVHAGIVLGRVPYPLLHHFEGNQGFAYDPYRFTLMNNFQYAADRFIALHTEWNGRGVLFNLIPGVRYAKLRELVTFKMAWGAYSPKHNSITTTPDGMQSLNIPYIEIGCGIGNILRVVDVYSVWRLTHRNNTEAPLWAMRFRLHIGY